MEPGTSRWSSAEAEIGWFLARKHSLFRGGVQGGLKRLLERLKLAAGAKPKVTL